MQRVSGIATSLYGSSVVLYGGRQRDQLWYLDLLSLEWHADVCEGTLPPATLFHAATVYSRHLVVCGGLSLVEVAEQEGLPRPPSSIPYKSMRPISLYRLDLAELQWMHVPCGGSVPTDRSHHAISMVGHSLVLVGGKPIGQSFSQGQLHQFESVGFFDPHVLDLRSNMWRKLDLASRVPRLWGQCVTPVDGGTALLIHGGFEIGLTDVGGAAAADSAALPVAELNNDLLVLNVEASTCTQFASPPDLLAPPPRAMHCALLRGRGELVVFGGLVVDEHTGTTLTTSLDMWSWSPVSGVWRPVPFCFDVNANVPPPPYPFAKFPATVYSETVVVVSTDLTKVFLYDGARWNVMPCDASRLSSQQHSPFAQSNLQETESGAADFTGIGEAFEDVSPLRAQVAQLRDRVREAMSGGPQDNTATALPSSAARHATLDDIMRKTLGVSHASSISPLVASSFVTIRDASSKRGAAEALLQPRDVQRLLDADGYGNARRKKLLSPAITKTQL